MADIIKPRTLSGFRDFLPEAMMARESLVETARRVYRSFGFAPIDTPALEYFEILAGKGSEETDRQMYQFKDQGDRHVGMRFDLTVPLARYCAQHIHELGTPFKRYHIASVWRGERAQAGRYREFMQCDFDTVGTTSVNSDIESAIVIFELMRAIGFERFLIRINNRKVLNGFLQNVGLLEQSAAVLRSVDKLEKIGREKVVEELKTQTPAGDSQIEQTLKLVEQKDSNRQTIEHLQSLVKGNELGEQGVAELRLLVDAVEAIGITEANLQIDPSIARGLDYYTGTVFETTLLDLPKFGSVCSGGRYDNLAELYTKQELPGVGASLGLDRLLAAMEKLELVKPSRSPAPVLVTLFEREFLSHYLQIASQIRAAGINCEVYPEFKKIGQQLKYADRKGFAAAIVAGKNEIDEQQVQLKDLAKGQQIQVAYDGNPDQLIEKLKELVL